MYRITKTYGHEQGFSCAFRQWRAEDTHCRFIHGYAIKFQLVFEGPDLDERNWLISFGELKEVKKWITDNFDHKTCVAKDDPHLATFIALDEAGIIQLNVVNHVGIEKFAEMVANEVMNMLGDKLKKNNVALKEVTLWEHDGNSGTYVVPVKEATPNTPWDQVKLREFSRSEGISAPFDPRIHLINAAVSKPEGPYWSYTETTPIGAN